MGQSEGDWKNGAALKYVSFEVVPLLPFNSKAHQRALNNIAFKNKKIAL